MYKNEVLAMFQQEKKAQKFDNNRRFYGSEESKIIAQVVRYCFDTGEVAKFKDLDSIVKLVRANLNNGVLSTFKNIVIYNSIGDIIVQCSKNEEDNISKINTTMITVGKNGNVSGINKTFIMEKDNYTGIDIEESFSEKELSRCVIDDIDSVSYNELDKNGKQLFKQMKICSSLFLPVLEKLRADKISTSHQKELYEMINDYKSNDNEVKKSASL